MGARHSCMVECVSIPNHCHIFQLHRFRLLFRQVPELSTIADAPKAKKTALPDDDDPIDIRKRLMDQRAKRGYQTIKERARQRRRQQQVTSIHQQTEAAAGQRLAEAKSHRHQEEEHRQLEAEAEAIRQQEEEHQEEERRQAEAEAIRQQKEERRQAEAEAEVVRRQRERQEVARKRATKVSYSFFSINISY